MTGQLTPQQLAAQIASLEARLGSKKLECDSLQKAKVLASTVIVQTFGYLDEATRETMLVTLENYLTAKINWLLIDIQEFELTVRMFKSQQSGILLARPSSNHRGN